ncbi:MAG: urease accessory protein UreJ [Verrucomicrobia bacterium]|nr:urease accessory protein UreJ [Pseudomonadota bacterium]NBS05928.1 urease accessory protein UreJ [Verrucomicrobiota bacterium]NBS78336.1 urease accessory protein UreJ [bacterium]NBS49264.1 urease accessory protein UreJ [Verrucomicrobiota bacterium]NBT23090.1 urease accessory protein UreJ [bacterium]
MRLLLLLLCLLPAPLFAHTGHGTLGFSSGFTHPVFGPDHLLAMLSVGILSAQMGGRAIWTVPLSFVCFMLVGGILGIIGIPFFSVEIAIALSVLTLGSAIAINKKFPTALIMAGVAFFALFHGHAHGEEMPGSAQPALYALGFVLGTTLIHLLGVLIGWLGTREPRHSSLLRISGVAIALVGAYFLSQALLPEKTSPTPPIAAASSAR